MSLRLTLLTLLSFTAYAGNADSGQSSATNDVLPKLNLLCGTPFTVSYDLESLKKNNKDIGWDQTSGSNECDEPLRLIWTLCQTDAGKAVVRRNELREVRCRGVKTELGNLSVKNGVITVDRAYEEPSPYVRAKEQFEAALKTKIPVKVADPYYDQAWRDLRLAPAPVTSTSDYCLVNGEKKKLDVQEGETRRDGTVKCFQNGKVIVELVIKNGRKNGLSRSVRDDDWYRSERYVDGKREGVSEQFEKGRLTRQELFKDDSRVWSKEFNEKGVIKAYFRQVSSGQLALRFTDEGRVTSLSCHPEAKGDEVMNDWCGFKGDRVVQLYDGTGRVAAIRTFRDGRVSREEPGDSAYAQRRSVTFDANGKKQGEERVLREDGTLDSVSRWKAGVQDGDEELYSKDGKKVITRATWKDGVRTVRTEFFLNGNPKLKETFDGDLMTRTTWFDVGPKQSEAQLKRCQRYSGWCEEGTSKRWYQNEKLAEETRYVAGQRDGVSKSWFDNGTLAQEETWAKGERRSAKTWNDKGELQTDEEYEEDGSRKLKR